MDGAFKGRFMALWQKYFGDAPLPMVFYYTDKEEEGVIKVKAPEVHRCMVADLARVAVGKSILFDAGSIGCFGGKHYLGYSEGWMPHFEYFLSCGLPGTVEGERYKKTPELVKDYTTLLPGWKAPAPYMVFKRWDKIADGDDPQVAIFFASPDVLSGLFTLANFDVKGLDGVMSPFGSGCAAIVQFPYLERETEGPKAVLGMLDVSARPCVRPNVLTFALPVKRLRVMAENMDESFLTTESWAMVRKRIDLATKEKAKA
ncbi:MAG TPA: DUF169 domain-containing protein [Syntrophorhabdaceae bacterium]|jgi:hypothetical protein